MSFIRTRIIKGKPYRYLETRWREGGKVRSKSVYLGFADALLSGGGPVPDHGRGQFGMERLVEQAKAMQAAPPTAPAPSAPAAPAAASPASPDSPEGQSPSDAQGSTPSS